MNIIKKYIKRTILTHNVHSPFLNNFITYQDKIDLRGPNYHKKILYNQDGHDRVGAWIDKNVSMMVSRLGSYELACLRFYLRSRVSKNRSFPDKIRFHMSTNAGFFPVKDESLDKFSEFFLSHAKNADIMGVWFNDFEDVICNKYCKGAELVELGCLEPFRFRNPWSYKLKGRKVLVVHPFVESIRKQYSEKRQILFDDPEILPDFELKTIKAVQSLADSEVTFSTWFDAYKHMCDEINSVDFDISIIGAGAYGLPLASFVKQMGKQAIHLGGVTQILFGIKGRRWEREYANTTAKLFNEHWIRPLKSETPKDYKRVEDGCYW